MINKYVNHLKDLINIERRSQMELMEEEIKELTAEDRERKGRTINNLSGKFVKKELKLTIAKFQRRYGFETEINVGDMVLISRGNPLAKNISGTVTEKRSKAIFVAFEGNIPDWVFTKNLRMDLFVNDITFFRMKNNLGQLSDQGRLAIKFMIKDSNPASGSKSSRFSYEDDSLNQFQKNAIAQSLNTKNFFLIHGPFGTGKTKTLVELIAQEVKRKNKVLATAESNTAVDNIVERLAKKQKLEITRLGHPQKVSKEIKEQTLSCKMQDHRLYKKIEKDQKRLNDAFKELKNCKKPTNKKRGGLTNDELITRAKRNQGTTTSSASEVKSMARWIKLSSRIDSLIKNIRNTEKMIVKDIVEASDVILTTNSSAALEEIANIKFDVAIIDEASQTTIPSILIPIAKAKRFILAGDHKQLPPTVLSESAKELELTMFEKLIEKYPNKKQLLNVQFRMNKMLMDFPNSEFYNNELICDENVKDISISAVRKKLDLDSPLVFIDTSNHRKNKERKMKYSRSYINPLESNVAIQIVDDYLNLGFNEKDIGIISPYADQVGYLKNKVDVDVKTVDGFQGKEKEIIIISTVRSNKWGNIGFLSDLRRLNVAITRAKKKLIIIGNIETLNHNHTYKRLIDYCKMQEVIIEL